MVLIDPRALQPGVEDGRDYTVGLVGHNLTRGRKAQVSRGVHLWGNYPYVSEDLLTEVSKPVKKRGGSSERSPNGGA